MNKERTSELRPEHHRKSSGGGPVCLVAGVGPGTGKALVERFAEGYQVAMLVRSAHQPRSAWGFNVLVRPFAEPWSAA